MDHTLRRIVIAGGSGFIGTALTRHLCKTYDVAILGRKTNVARGIRGGQEDTQRNGIRSVQWNARELDRWAEELEGAYAIINLTGKSVNCRYTAANKKEILESRTLSTKVLGEAVKSLENPPKVWIQMSSSTIYRHSEDKPMDETFGEIGDDFSMNVCREWERTFNELELPGIRKVIMRTAFVLGPDDGAFPTLFNLVRFGLGGKQGSGKQMMSWIHIKDVVGVVDWMLNRNVDGVFNVTGPQPIDNQTFMKTFRKIHGSIIGLPSPKWLLTFGSALIGTEPELILKSRWIIPKRLLQEGYRFQFTSLDAALKDLLK